MKKIVVAVVIGFSLLFSLVVHLLIKVKYKLANMEWVLTEEDKANGIVLLGISAIILLVAQGIGAYFMTKK
jgi:hypothetical protein